MAMDPNDLGQGLGGDGDPATGTPPNPASDQAAEVERLKRENAKLREERRHSTVDALVEAHGLSAKQALVIARLDTLDEIEAKAKEFAEANRAAAASAPAGEQPAPAPTEPAGQPTDAEGLQAMGEGGEGAQPTAASLSWRDQMDQEINGAESLEEVAQIQLKYKKLQQAAQQ
jgi:hypothetical protein